MTYERPRSGIYATVNGAEYPCGDYPRDDHVLAFSRARDNPDPTLFTSRDADQRWVAQVHVDRCERLAQVTTRAGYQGHECQVISIAPSGEVGVYFLGDDRSAARRDGFIQVDPGTWAKTVNIYELYSFREHHIDLLYERWWRKHHPANANSGV
jgi:hypothetical protein